MNLELNDEGRAMVRGFRQLGVGLLNPAQEAGVVLGDVLLECNGFLIDTFDVAVETLKQAGTEPLKLVMRREDGACGERVYSYSSSSSSSALPPPPPAPPQLGSGGGSTSSHFGSAKWRGR
jgi:membrane-associated protease RseP (regulator of RpoE activity)